MLILQAAHVEKDAWKAAKTIYEFSAKDIDGNNVSLDRYKSVQYYCYMLNTMYL